RSAAPYMPDMPMQPSPTADVIGPAAPNCRVRCISGHVREVPSAQAKPPAMTELQASRTLVKSPPELWAECSDAASLARHLDGFGEIRITRLEPETAVAWEGERARGTVRIEPAGWGTKVILTAVAEGEVPVADAPPIVEAPPMVYAPPVEDASPVAEAPPVGDAPA